MGYSGAWGKIIHVKNWNRRSRVRLPLSKFSTLLNRSVSGPKTNSWSLLPNVVMFCTEYLLHAVVYCIMCAGGIHVEHFPVGHSTVIFSLCNPPPPLPPPQRDEDGWASFHGLICFSGQPPPFFKIITARVIPVNTSRHVYCVVRTLTRLCLLLLLILLSFLLFPSFFFLNNFVAKNLLVTSLHIFRIYWFLKMSRGFEFR